MHSVDLLIAAIIHTANDKLPTAMARHRTGNGCKHRLLKALINCEALACLTDNGVQFAPARRCKYRLRWLCMIGFVPVDS